MTQLPSTPASPGSKPWHASGSASDALKAEAKWRNAKSPEAKAKVEADFRAGHHLRPSAQGQAREPEPEAGL